MREFSFTYIYVVRIKLLSARLSLLLFEFFIPFLYYFFLSIFHLLQNVVAANRSDISFVLLYSHMCLVNYVCD